MHAHSRLLSAIAAFVVSACSRSPEITVHNNADVPLQNIMLSGSGFSVAVPDIDAGAAKTVQVQPRGESGLRLAFDAHGRHIDVGDLAYIEAGYNYVVDLTVQPDLRSLRSRRFQSSRENTPKA